MESDQHAPEEPEPDEQTSTFIPPGISARRPVNLERYSINARRL